MGSGSSKEQIKKAKEQEAKIYQIALRFLRDPKVESISYDSKVSFLKEKGLKLDRIKEALQEVSKDKKGKQSD